MIVKPPEQRVGSDDEYSHPGVIEELGGNGTWR